MLPVAKQIETLIRKHERLLVRRRNLHTKLEQKVMVRKMLDHWDDEVDALRRKVAEIEDRIEAVELEMASYQGSGV